MASIEPQIGSVQYDLFTANKVVPTTWGDEVLVTSFSTEIIMQEVGRFSLANKGAFVVRIQFVYVDDRQIKHEVTATEPYPPMMTREVSPGNYGVPDGSMVSLKAGVMVGDDNRSQQNFIYRASNQQVADFSISGTTLTNNLEFLGLRTLPTQAIDKT